MHYRDGKVSEISDYLNIQPRFMVTYHAEYKEGLYKFEMVMAGEELSEYGDRIKENMASLRGQEVYAPLITRIQQGPCVMRG
ncbi:hypothetical protein C3432_11830 [Citrobacter amalonaticus]|uniref:Uncharacterized protein n=1 Tax=Citrobacter amalonaticus TaxID=35703 RepID=A0A2S4RRG0_CITAM|nr:hypothetical protein C3432_11830 [Citrobacter amalonaticus]POT70303.1 hypothetical protein C3436_24530 [Citrobacter amalonaticus]POU61287.1 hypothetical protein C3430_23440 [Citrobacter amalonaticus]POV05144.1 hypothetical protein C3424_07290 [Citrobacter amalonaticus]